MMDWQTWIALSITAASGIFLVRRIAIALRRRACGGCLGCSANTADGGKPQAFVSLEQVERRFPPVDGTFSTGRGL